MEEVKYLRRIDYLKKNFPWLKWYLITNDEYDLFWHIAILSSIMCKIPPFAHFELQRQIIQDKFNMKTRHELYMGYSWMRKDPIRDRFNELILNAAFEQARRKGLQ